MLCVCVCVCALQYPHLRLWLKEAKVTCYTVALLGSEGGLGFLAFSPSPFHDANADTSKPGAVKAFSCVGAKRMVNIFIPS